MTVAGTGQTCTTTMAPKNPCGDGGKATHAQLNIPHYLIAAPNGAFIIADRGDNRVRQVLSGRDHRHGRRGRASVQADHRDMRGRRAADPSADHRAAGSLTRR